MKKQNKDSNTLSHLRHDGKIQIVSIIKKEGK
jgi:hypothetical protein